MRPPFTFQRGVALLALLLPACRATPDTGAVPAATWRADQVAVIGADTGIASFASVRSLLFSATGELYVVDHRDRQVKVFDSTGRFIRLLGRSGAGPGEYGDPYSVAWLNDTLALLDPGNSRIGLFAPGGAWAGSLPVQPISGGSDVRLYRSGPATFWAYGYRVVDQKAQSLLIRYTGVGAVDTLLYIRSDGPSYTITCETTNRSLRFFTAPFAPGDLLVPTPTGARAFARTDAYRITFLGPRGDTLRTLTLDEPSRPIPDQAWAEGVKEWEEFRAASSGAKCDGTDLDRPARMPVLASLAYDPSGRLWVEVVTAEGTRYDVWQEDRRIAPVIGLPPSDGVDPAFFGDLIALPLADEGSGPQVAIFRISPAS